MKYVVLACFLHAFTFLYAQQKVNVRLIDAQTKTAIQDAEIRNVKNKSVVYSDKSGYFTSSETDTIEIKKTGYNALLTVIKKGSVVELEPLAGFLSEVIVSASREQQRRQEMPAAISKINSTTIAETKATALYQLLNKSAGVYMVNLGNEQHTMAIRQPITYNALYLYLEDGLPIRPTGIFNHNALYEINMNALKSIEVLKGPASSLYGSNAIGGSVNFLSANPSSVPTLNASVQGDGYHYYRADASTGFTQNKLGVFISAYAAKQKNSWQDYTDFDKYSANIKTTYDFSAGTRLTFSGSYNYLNTQTPGSLDSARFYNRSYGSNQRFTYRKVNALRLSSRIDHQWDRNNSTFFTAFFRDNSTGQLPSYYIADVRDTKTKAYIRSTGQVNNQSFNSYGFLLQHRANFTFLNSQLIFGAYLDNSPSSFYAKFLNISKDLSTNYYSGYTTTDSLIDNYKIRLFNTAAFAQYQINPVKPLHIVAGLRYDNLLYDFKNSLPESNTRYKHLEKNNFNIWAPKLGVTYDLGKGFGLYGNLSIGFQPPETSFLYNSRQLTSLKQATFYNYEIGTWLPFSDKLNAELSLFDMRGKNEIISVLMADNTTQNQNAGETDHLGLEYTLYYTPAKQLAFRLSGTLAKHSYKEYSEVVSGQSVSYNGNRMTNAPSSIINSEITWKPKFIKGFRSATEWQYISRYFVNSANSKTYNGYDIFNLRLGYSFSKASLKGAGLWLNVLNVTDKLYATNVTGNQYGVTYNAAPPRTISLGLSYNLSH